MNEEIIQNLNDRLDTAIERGRELLEDEEVQVRLEELKNKTEHSIRENPIGAVLAGFAAGFIVAKILKSED